MKAQSECKTIHFLVGLLLLGLCKKTRPSERLIHPVSLYMCAQSHMHTHKCINQISIEHVIAVLWVLYKIETAISLCSLHSSLLPKKLGYPWRRGQFPPFIFGVQHAQSPSSCLPDSAAVIRGLSLWPNLGTFPEDCLRSSLHIQCYGKKVLKNSRLHSVAESKLH